MKRFTILFALLALPALAQNQPEKAEIQVSEEVAKRCEEEGGCRLISMRAFAGMINQAQQQALQEGFRQGMQQGSQKGCRRGDTI